MIKKIALITFTLLITACSSSKPEYAKKSAANDKKYAEMQKDKNMVCEYVATTGSHRKKRVCMSKPLGDEIRRRNQDALRSQEHKGQTSAGGNT